MPIVQVRLAIQNLKNAMSLFDHVASGGVSVDLWCHGVSHEHMEELTSLDGAEVHRTTNPTIKFVSGSVSIYFFPKHPEEWTVQTEGGEGG